MLVKLLCANLPSHEVMEMYEYVYAATRQY